MSKRMILSLALAAAATAMQAQRQTQTPTPTPTLQRYLIEREIPGASKLSAEELRGGAAKSNAVLRELGPDIQWVQSYVAGDKVYCVYLAPSEALIREHAAKSGFPANRITPIATVIDPSTAAPKP
jgi:hypothetical protein